MPDSSIRTSKQKNLDTFIQNSIYILSGFVCGLLVCQDLLDINKDNKFERVMKSAEPIILTVVKIGPKGDTISSSKDTVAYKIAAREFKF